MYQGISCPLYGVSKTVLKLVTFNDKPLAANEVRLKVLYSPINPADLNMIEGRYVVQPEQPFVPGNEGVCEVVACGKSVRNIGVGDRVICPFQGKHMWQGFWQERVVFPADYCIKVPDFIDSKQAAMLSINTLTAYLLLTLFVDLKPGDWIIQNLANSALGRWIIYFSKQLGYRTVNVVRNKSTVDTLMSLGGTEVCIAVPDFSKHIPQKGICKLALNGVGGYSATEVVKCLQSGGTMVTYGAMSKEHVTFGNALLIYRQVIIRGFNRTLWVDDVSVDQVKSCFESIFKILLQQPFEIPIDKIFCFTECDSWIQRLDDEPWIGKRLISFI